ncbi:UNVERIFIED_CONTAM: hypothetical protein K2H54_060987 [Gekko kuhli]
MGKGCFQGAPRAARVGSASSFRRPSGVTQGLAWHSGRPASRGKEKISPGRGADHSQAAPDSESVIVAMERVSVLFDRVRKGFPFEARVVARILPQFLDDFFPPQDVMNKVIGEFLSNQQPYPQFMATVVYKVFQTLHTTGQSSMVRDWVMLSLSNFTQRTPVAMAMWSLSCFFVSASTSQWISAMYPLQFTVSFLSILGQESVFLAASREALLGGLLPPQVLSPPALSR